MNESRKVTERINFDYLCRKCWKFQKDDEDFYGFNVEDDYGHTIEFRGHKECIDEMREVFAKVVKIEK